MYNLYILTFIADIYVMDSGNVPVDKRKPFVITTTALVFFIVFLVISLSVCIQVRFVMELRIVLQEKMNIYVSSRSISCILSVHYVCNIMLK